MAPPPHGDAALCCCCAWSCGVGAGVGGENGGCVATGDLAWHASGEGVVRGDCDHDGEWLWGGGPTMGR